MSDLRSELVAKVINQWDNQIAMDKSFGEQVFDYVKANPFVTSGEISNALNVTEAQSLGSQLKTLVDRGILQREEKPVRNYPGFGRKTQYEYFTTTDKYKTINEGYWKKAPKSPKRGRPLGSKNTPKVIIKPADDYMSNDMIRELRELDRMATTPREREPLPNEFNPEIFVQELSLKDAKAVFEVLKGYFG